MVRIIRSQSTVAADRVAMQLHDFAQQARDIVLQARQEATRIVSQARQQAQEAVEQARQKGYAEGFARGQNDALASVPPAAGDAPGEMLNLVRSVLGELALAHTRHDEQAGELLALSIQIAGKIVGQVAVNDVSAARANLAKVLEMSAASREMVVRVNPDQLEQLRSHARELVDELAIRGKVDLVADEQIAPGGVKLQTRNGELDATIARQLDNVVDALLGDGAAGPLFGVYKPEQAGRDEAVPAGADAGADSA